MHPAGPLFRNKFLRVVLDEAHLIRNRNTKAAKAAWDLEAEYRWSLTGTLVVSSFQTSSYTCSSRSRSTISTMFLAISDFYRYRLLLPGTTSALISRVRRSVSPKSQRSAYRYSSSLIMGTKLDPTLICCRPSLRPAPCAGTRNCCSTASVYSSYRQRRQRSMNSISPKKKGRLTWPSRRERRSSSTASSRRVAS